MSETRNRQEDDFYSITYSAYWIKQSIFRYNENCAGSIRVPAYMKSNRKYERYRYVYRNEHGRYPGEAELCQELKLSSYSLMRLEETIYNMRAVRLDEPAYGADADECFLAFLRSDDDLEETVTYSVYRSELHRELEKALGILDQNTRNNTAFITRDIPRSEQRSFSDAAGRMYMNASGKGSTVSGTVHTGRF